MAVATVSIAQKVIDTCEAKWEAQKGDCSGFAKAVATALGISLSGDANAITDHISEKWSKCTDGKDAAAKAKAGNFVIAGLKAKGHGHVAVIVDGALANGLYPVAYWGKFGGIGKKKTTVNYSWIKTDLAKLGYWYTPIAEVPKVGPRAARIINWHFDKFITG